MYNIDRPKFAFVSVLEEFIRETEHSLAYFFAILIFLLTFLLALFGREALYTGLVGVLCLLLIKLRDFIDGFKETRQDFIFYPSEKNNRSKPDFDEKALIAMADKFPEKFKCGNDFSVLSEPDLLSYLKTFWKIMETASLFIPEQPLKPETKRAVKKMTVTAQKGVLYWLKKKYSLTKMQMREIKRFCFDPDVDAFWMQTQLETAGIEEKTAGQIVKILEILKKIQIKINATDSKEQTSRPSA